MGPRFRCWLGSAVLVYPLAVAAQAGPVSDVKVSVGTCKAGIKLAVRETPLTKVLEELSRSLSFELHDEAQSDRLITLEAKGSGSELLNRLLASHERFMVSHARDPRCPGQTRIASVWLFSSGQGGSLASAKAAPARASTSSAPVARPTPITQIGTPEMLRENEQRSRELKQAYDAYVNKYGKPPPGVEEEAARP